MKKEIETFKALNEDLNTKLSLSDNKLLAVKIRNLPALLMK